MNKKLLLIAVLNLFLYSSFSQNQKKTDSLLTVLKTAKEDTSKVNMLIAVCTQKNYVGEIAEARKYADEALALSEKINFKKGIANSYMQIGNIFSGSSDYPKALEYFQKALAINEQISNKTGIARNLTNMGIVHAQLSDYARALEYYQNALTINDQSGNKEGAAFDLGNIGNVYGYLSDYTKALEYYQKTLALYEQLGNKSGISRNLNNIGWLSYNLSDYTKALEYYQRALIINEQLSNKAGAANNLGNIGIVYLKLTDYSRALEYFQKALKIAEEIEDKKLIADSYNNLGEVNQKRGNFPEALKYETKGLALALEIGSKGDIEQTYGQLAVLDSSMNNFRGAYENHKLYMQYNDSIFNIEKDKKLTQLQMKYDFAKVQDSTKAEQAKKDIVAVKELQKQKLERNGFIGGFAVVLLFAGIFFTQRNKIKTGKQRSDALLLNILPSEVAEELKAKGSADAKQFNEVTVMFTDFKNFTQISEKLSPTELVNEIHTCFKAFDNIIGKHNIEKIKTIGDAYMCAGGLPVANKTNAPDVVSAALEIQQFMQLHLAQRKIDGKEPFEIRIGIHTGPVVAGIVGVKKFAYDIWGDTVNIASRMESSGEAGKVNISGSTYELVKDKFPCTHRGKILAKNKGEIDMYFVEGIS